MNAIDYSFGLRVQVAFFVGCCQALFKQSCFARIKHGGASQDSFKAETNLVDSSSWILSSLRSLLCPIFLLLHKTCLRKVGTTGSLAHYRHCETWIVN